MADRIVASPESLDNSDLIVVSDLHMSLGADPAGRVDPYEQFRADSAFVAFLEYLAARADTRRRSSRLVILGDFLDFLHARSAAAGRAGLRLDTSEAASLVKLDRISHGHRAVFEALGRFAAAGNRISIVPGNHDIELIRSSAQRRVRELIEGTGGDGAGVTFHPWIFFVPGVVYAEHGSQYHDINAFRALLTPYGGDESGEIEVPLGSALSAYVIELLESLPTRSEPVEPTLRNAVAGLRDRPSLALRTLPLHAEFAKFGFAFLARRLRPQNGARSEYHARVLAPYADDLGLRRDVVASIDRLAALSSPAMARRLVRAAVSGSESAYLRRAAVAVDELLERNGAAVPFYVFGHAHRPCDVAVRPGSSGPRYLNSGTWSLLVPEAARELATGGRQTFVEIVRDGDRPSARLLWWNDAAGRAEPVEPV